MTVRGYRADKIAHDSLFVIVEACNRLIVEAA